MTTSPQTVLSPCIGKCTLNAQQICKGCFRAIDEIRLWSSMTEDEKQNSLVRCQQRRQQRRNAQRA